MTSGLGNFSGQFKRLIETVILAPCENEPLFLDLFFTEIYSFSNTYFIGGVLIDSSSTIKKELQTLIPFTVEVKFP